MVGPSGLRCISAFSQGFALGWRNGWAFGPEAVRWPCRKLECPIPWSKVIKFARAGRFRRATMNASVAINVAVIAVGLWAGLAATGRAVDPAADPAALDHFETRVRPLLAERCWKCHGEEKSEANLRLDRAEGIARGGDSGPPVS